MIASLRPPFQGVSQFDRVAPNCCAPSAIPAASRRPRCRTINRAEAADAYPRRWLALSILLLASFMNLIDVTIVNVALPGCRTISARPARYRMGDRRLCAGLRARPAAVRPAGRYRRPQAHVPDRRRLFTLVSALCGLAPSIEMLIGARVLQGLAGAMMTPQVLAIAR